MDRNGATRGQKIDALDGFRGLAALFVCVYHAPELWGFPLPHAPLAVDLFFLLSGFVIGHSYDQRLRDAQLSPRRFALIRLIRLYPMYLISLLLVSSWFLIGALVHHRSGAEHLAAEYLAATLAGLFVLPMKLTGDTVLFPLNIVYWSLFFELLCNFAYAALQHKLTNRMLIGVIALSALVLVVATRLNATMVDLGPIWTWTSFIGGLARSVLGISGGLLMYRLSPHFTTSSRRGLHPLLPMLLIALALGTPSIGGSDWLLQLLAVFVVFPVCVASVIPGAQAPVSAPSAGSRLLILLGIASYPIYVLHAPLSHLLEMLAGKRLTQFAPVSGLCVTLLIVAVSIVLAQAVDAPFRRYLTRRVFAERSPRAAVAPGLA